MENDFSKDLKAKLISSAYQYILSLPNPREIEESNQAIENDQVSEPPITTASESHISESDSAVPQYITHSKEVIE
jgi:hypothetical protein